MQVTEVVADGRFAEPVLRDATPQEEQAVAIIARTRIDEDHADALKEAQVRSALSAYQQAYPDQAQMLYNLLAALGLNTFTVQEG